MRLAMKQSTRQGFRPRRAYTPARKRELAYSATPAGWRELCHRPQIAWSVKPLITQDVAHSLIAAARPSMSLQPPAPQYADVSIDYRSLPLAACGATLIDQLTASGLPDMAAQATGIPAHPEEDIMVARTASLTPGKYRAGGLLNLHHDRHKQDTRLVTFMVNLASLDAEHAGGETWFPAANSLEGDPLVEALEDSYRAGVRFLPRNTEIATECERRMLRTVANAESGVCVPAKAGTALMFDADACAAAWHAPGLVFGPGEKWTVTWFKAVPPLWSSMLQGM